MRRWLLAKVPAPCGQAGLGHRTSLVTEQQTLKPHLTHGAFSLALLTPRDCFTPTTHQDEAAGYLSSLEAAGRHAAGLQAALDAAAAAATAAGAALGAATRVSAVVRV